MAAKKIFLVDDDADDQEIFLAALEEVAPEVSCEMARNGREALQKIDNTNFSADLVLLDLNMPLMNGKEFLTEVRRRDLLQQVPVIVFTTSSDPATKAEMAALGAADFITKPENYEKLISTVRRIVQ